jgi:hypothetical protein
MIRTPKDSMNLLPSMLLAGLSLLGCAPDARTLVASRDNVTVEYAAGRERDAERRASTLCGDFGRQARLRSVGIPRDRRQLAVYDCLP